MIQLSVYFTGKCSECKFSAGGYIGKAKNCFKVLSNNIYYAIFPVMGNYKLFRACTHECKKWIFQSKPSSGDGTESDRLVYQSQAVAVHFGVCEFLEMDGILLYYIYCRNRRN